MESTEKEPTEGLVEKMDEITNGLVEKITESASVDETELGSNEDDPLSMEEMMAMTIPGASIEPIAPLLTPINPADTEDEYDAKIERLLRLFYDRNNYSEFEFGGRLMDMLNATDRFDPKFVIELKAFAEEIKAYSSTSEDGAIIELIENL